MKRKKSMLALALAIGYLSNTLLQPVLHGEEAVIPVQIEDHTLSPSTLSEDTASSSTLTSETEDTLSRKKRDLGHPEEIVEIDGVQYVKLTPIITTKLETRYKSYYRENAIHGYKYLDESVINLIKKHLTSEIPDLSTFNRSGLDTRHGQPAAIFTHDENGYYLRAAYTNNNTGKKYLIPIYSDDSVYVAPSVDLLYPKNKGLCDPNTATIQNWFKENLVDVSDFEITDRNIKQETLNGGIRYYYDVSVTNTQGESHAAKLRILNRFEDSYDPTSGAPWERNFWLGENFKNFKLLPYATKDENKTALVFDINRFNAGVDNLTETEKMSIKQTLSRIWNNASWGISDMEVLGKGELDGDPVIRLKITDDDGHSHYENLPIVNQETLYMHSFADLSKYDISKLYVGGDFIYVGDNPNVKKIPGQDIIKGWLKRKNAIKENEKLGDVEIKTIESSSFSGEKIYKTEITYPVIKNGEIVRRIVINVTKPDEYPGDGSTQIVLSTPIGSGRAVTELDKAEIFRVLNNTYPEIKDIEMLNDGFFVSPSDHYAKTTVKVIYAGDKNSVTECGPKPACEINECMKNNEFQNLLIYVHTPEKGEFRSKVTTSCPPRMYIDAPKPSLDSGNTCAYAKKSAKTGVLNPEDMHFNRTPRTTAIKPLCNTGLEPHDDEDNEPKPGFPSPACPPNVDYYGNPIGYDYCDGTVVTPNKPSPACPPTMTTVEIVPATTVSEEPKKPCDSGDCVEVVPGTPSPTPEEETTKPTEPSKPSEPETEASTEATKETEAPKPPKPRNPDRVKPTEPAKETEPETVKPTEPVSPSEIERSIPKNSKPSTPIPPATPSKPKITMHKNGEVRGNHRDLISEKYDEVYGSNRPFYVDENGEKVYYTDRTVHTGDERNMQRNMLLMLSAFGLLVLYGTMRFLKKLDIE